MSEKFSEKRPPISVTIVLDPDNFSANFTMHGPDWKGGPFTFDLGRTEDGFAVRDADPVDPADDRFGNWDEAVGAFVELVRFHLQDVLEGTEEERHGDGEGGTRCDFEARMNLVKAMYGLDE